MNRSSKSCSRCLPAAFLTLLFVSTIATGQTTPEGRDHPPVLTLTTAGDGVPVLLRWRIPEERTDRTMFVSTQTMPSINPRSDIDGKEPDVVLRGFTRPPMEKIWTLAGRMTRDDTGVTTARWRVVDGAARLTGVEGLARARAGKEKGEEKKNPDPGKSDQPTDQEPQDGVDAPGIGATKPGTPALPRGAARADPLKQDKRILDARASSSESTSSQKALERAMTLERIADEAVGRTGGATITQKLSEGGLDPSSIRARLTRPDRRADYEIQTLLQAMRLGEVQLPSQPVSIGAVWKTSWDCLINDVPVRTEVTWTLKKTDEAAKETNIAETATIDMEYQRRLLDPGDSPSRRELALEADGRGRLVVDLDEPLVMEARLVEQPILDLKDGRSRLVTRYRLEPSRNP